MYKKAVKQLVLYIMNIIVSNNYSWVSNDAV